jgi:hypothetical protein
MEIGRTDKNSSRKNFYTKSLTPPRTHDHASRGLRNIPIPLARQIA